MTERPAVLNLSTASDLEGGTELPVYAHLPVPSPDEDDEDETVRRNPGGGNIDPDDDEGGDDDDEDEDDDEEGLVLNGGAVAETIVAAFDPPIRGRISGCGDLRMS
jgi:hypothetical protein